MKQRLTPQPKKRMSKTMTKIYPRAKSHLLIWAQDECAWKMFRRRTNSTYDDLSNKSKQIGESVWMRFMCLHFQISTQPLHPTPYTPRPEELNTTDKCEK